VVSRAIALAALACACGARPPPARRPSPPPGDAIALYRDRAFIEQQVALVAPAAGPVTVDLAVAAGLTPDDITVLDAGGLSLSSVRIADAPTPDHPALALTADAPRAGRFAITIGYVTDRVRWDAAYTLTTTAARDRAILRGAIAIRNLTGTALRGHAVVVDDSLGSERTRSTDQLARLFAAAEATGAAAHRELGAVALAPGETRLELPTGGAPRPMRRVLVYDPIGVQLDHASAAPASDPELGTAPAPPHVTESVEIERDEPATRGLPAGPVRLFERGPDGALDLLGEARLFDAQARGARTDTIAIGTASGLTGHRQRRDWIKDSDQKRLSEEMLITLDNARPGPVDVVVREHLYRGLNWTLAYQSAPAAKEGPQQIALRTTVPANGHAKVLYVVVYTW
jgi:hypothetical protein